MLSHAAVCGMKGLANHSKSKLAMQVCHHAAAMLPHSPTCATDRSSCPLACAQVAERVRTDPRVRVMERTNLRALRLPDIGGRPVDLVTLDLSFISVLKVLDAVG